MAGRDYDRVVIVLRATVERSGPLKESTETWAELTRVMAKRSPVSDGERDRAAQVGAFRTDRFETWWTATMATVTPKDRLRCGGVTYDITSPPRPLGGFEDRLEITAKARAD